MSHAGCVSHVGAQREIFKTGRADAKISLAELSDKPNLYALGPVSGLDGEITIFDSQPYVSQVRGGGDAYVIDRTFDHGAIFLAWTQTHEWDELAVAESVSSYEELELFIRQAAREQALDVDAPFPFLMGGTVREIGWHINVDRTDGQLITRELFRESKQKYMLRGERVDVFGVHSERHGGILMSEDMKIHIHFVSRDSAATGHIDEIVPGSLTLRLPRKAQAARPG